MDARLLIADGQPRSRATLEHFFDQCGFRVETASDGWQCRAKICSMQPHVLAVRSDILGGGAAAVVTFLRQAGHELQMPAVLIVGDQSPNHLSRQTGVPRSWCFQTPLAMERLLDRVGLAIALVDLRRNPKFRPVRAAGTAVGTT